MIALSVGLQVIIYYYGRPPLTLNYYGLTLSRDWPVLNIVYIK